MKSKLKAIYIWGREERKGQNISYLLFLAPFIVVSLFIVYFHTPTDEHIKRLVIEQYAPCWEPNSRFQSRAKSRLANVYGVAKTTCVEEQFQIPSGFCATCGNDSISALSTGRAGRDG